MTEKPRYILLPLTGIFKGKTLWLEGQVLHLRSHHKEVKADESRWKNVFRVISAYLPGNTRNGLLEIEISGRHRRLTLTRGGFFNIRFNNLEIKDPIPTPSYYFLRNDRRHNVLIPEYYNREIFHLNGFHAGVISDIDDTILVSHVGNHIKRLQHLLAKNAYRRKPVSRMASAYRKLESKNLGMFYVSNSEANLYPMIHTFLGHQGFPEGPLFLKPYKRWKDLLKPKKKIHFSKHKKEKIQEILELFRSKNFILIGDDSQKDAEIYEELANQNPGRIKGIFIRKTGRNPDKLTHRIKGDMQGHESIPIRYFNDPDTLIMEIEDILL